MIASEGSKTFQPANDSVDGTQAHAGESGGVLVRVALPEPFEDHALTLGEPAAELVPRFTPYNMSSMS